MNIGLALLYAAFAVVALWLLGELLLQHRAPAHWRGLALLGFLALVAGVHQGSAVIVGGGVLAFGAGQGLVTRSVKRGEGPHWSLRGRDGALPGPLGRVPLLDRVFPAAERPEPDGSAPAERVGAIGSVEDAPEPVLAGPGAEPELELVESQPHEGQQPYAAQAHDGRPQGAEQAGGPYGRPYPAEYPQAYAQQYAEPYPQPFPQPEGYPAEAYPQPYAPEYAPEYAQEYAAEYARQYAEQQGQPPFPGQPDGYYADPAAVPGYGYDPAAQAQQGYYQQQPPSPEQYDAVGYDPLGTYQYDYQVPRQQVPPQPYPAEPEPWNYG
ncbi:hypothetical protein [Streptacidiphilus sp. P02-A3a]|uniref:hypothetical protein n=1 Tax=Streptacidiphilus sp. P02-A3a TaxID=2704468 RepID=UPI0015FB4A8E|nr:hypothetical protein [Streptacidiphilus sp. P02-A3a]QMU68551.1 hypothetical protein GXP74_10205 [Streptacidiphilus sp. P02-A3a]